MAGFCLKPGLPPKLGATVQMHFARMTRLYGTGAAGNGGHSVRGIYPLIEGSEVGVADPVSRLPARSARLRGAFWRWY